MELRVEGLTKVYGSQIALNAVSFTLKGRGVYGYLGPNGAGKSTTFKILTGYLPPTRGSFSLGSWTWPGDLRTLQRHIGYLPEHNPLYLDMYVREYLLFRGQLYGLRGAPLKKRIEEVISRVGLTPEAHKLIGALSRGYRQRVGLASALLHAPPLLILDEPTSGLDPNQVIEIRQLIRELGQQHLVIFSSHILAEVQAIADHVIILHKGEVVLDAPLSDLETYLGKEEFLVETAPGHEFNWDFLGASARVEKVGPSLWQVQIPAGTDVREGIYRASVEQGVPLLRLEKRKLPLEEVFQRLTQPSA
uniref:Gliding motility-associated ABC transporter ATP-binding subunit GldA n=1 Tax=uncultured Bacteroidota bacterium TaxID=152509 RepID=H5SNV3_9BACT|nr:gliding motility-associated ABC transporter ATP-binding subunit GldA [uncultured Bacteroidetes bacterium]